jgi:release factor glutamine methyltransferase
MRATEVTGSVREALAETREILRVAGVAEARGEALHLWSAVTGRNPGIDLLADDALADPVLLARLRELVTRRAGGEPLGYVTGTMGFRYLNLFSDRRALIPRPETEGLIAVALQCTRTGVAADIGTGSGAIALALRQEGDFSEVIGSDLSPTALELATLNAGRTGLAVTWLEGDLLAPLGSRQVDLLVSNPPYLTEAEYLACDRSVRDYEPESALVSGPDGMLATRRLLTEGRQVVAPGGWIALEVDCRRADMVARLAEELGWVEVNVLDDLFGRARYVRAQLRNTR